jgi:DNA-3-methyladenine glycosylase II
VLRDLIDRIGPLDEDARRRGRPDDAYGALLRAIVGQQLSTRAARAIYARVLDLFGGRVPKPAELMAIEPDVLRAAGLSRAKVAYPARPRATCRDRAARDRPPDRSARRRGLGQLLAVKGLGRWTVDMFLMFHLRRPDVVASGDLGIRGPSSSPTGCRRGRASPRSSASRSPGGPYRHDGLHLPLGVAGRDALNSAQAKNPLCADNRAAFRPAPA